MIMMIVKYFLQFLLIPVLSAGQETAYLPGEKVEYRIHYGVVQAGIATLELKA